MGNIPSDRNRLYAFARAHSQLWIDNAAMIGLTAPQANAVKLAALATGTAISDADIARSAARTINNFTLSAPDPALVYSKAQIAPPADRSSLPPPNAPTNLRVSLDPSTGSLIVRWRAAQPQGMTGVVYNIRRRIGAGGAFVQAALTGERRFEDVTIPAGTSQLACMIQAQRGSQTSPPSNIIEVRFGAGGGMSVTQFTVDEDEANNAMRMAA